jgi:hypothetical protein
VSKLIIETAIQMTEEDWLPETVTMSGYDHGLENTVSPFEYAFYLLGPIRGKTIVAAGCSDGLSNGILPKFDVQLIPAKVVDQGLVLAARDSTVDHVFCGPILRNVDPIVTGRQLRRVLKPGGTVIFNEWVDHERLVRLLAMIRSEYESLPFENRILTHKSVQAVCRAVGIPGRRREFWLTTPLLNRMGVRPVSAFSKIAQRIDAAVLSRYRSIRSLAFRVVWEARKEC